MKMIEEEIYIAIREALHDCIEHYLLYKAFYRYVDETMVLDEKGYCNVNEGKYQDIMAKMV